ncbi:MAG: hypothetical protein AUK48_12590 [Oscillatoriales cyanobacterium CG2_30_44_21]|nr:MAG: hypothetical protein AUK48_12590 [Oscillatoriales cyanobacterium CG2_30_44_21]
MTQAIVRKSLYEADFFLWTQDTIAKIKNGNFDDIDWGNLIEEIESLGKSDKREIESRLYTLLEHLLKLIYIDMPQEFNGWKRTIREQRRQLKSLLKQSPSLKSIWSETFESAFTDSLNDVREDYPQYQFPDKWQFECDIDTMLNVDFWNCSTESAALPRFL